MVYAADSKSLCCCSLLLTVAHSIEAIQLLGRDWRWTLRTVNLPQLAALGVTVASVAPLLPRFTLPTWQRHCALEAVD